MSSEALSKIINNYSSLNLEDKYFLLESISFDFMYNKKYSESKKRYIKFLKRKIDIIKIDNIINKLYNIKK